MTDGAMRFSRAFWLTFLTREAGIAFGVLNAVVVARCLGAAGIGTYLLISTAAQLICLVGSLGLGYASNLLAARDAGSARQLLAQSLLPAAVLALAAAAATHVPGANALLLGPVPAELTFQAWCGAALLAVHAVLAGILFGLERLTSYAVVMFLPPAGIALTNAVLLGFGGRPLSSALDAWLAWNAAAVMLAFVLIWREAPPTNGLKAALFIESLSVGGRSLVASVLGFTAHRGLLLFVNQYVGAAALGLFSVAFSMAELLQHAPAAAASLVFARASSRRQSAVDVAAIVRLHLWLGGVALVLLCLGAPLLLTLLFGSRFAAAAPVLRILAIGSYAAGAWLIASSYLAGRHAMPVSVVGLSAFATATTLGLCALLAPRSGITGAAWAWALATGLTLAFGLVLFCRDAAAELSAAALIPRPREIAGQVVAFASLLAPAAGAWSRRLIESCWTSIVRRWGRLDRFEFRTPPSDPAPGRWRPGVLALALIGAAMAAWAGPLLLSSADTWWHLSMVHHGIASGEMLPRPPGEPLPLNGGVWHGVVALVCRITGQEPLPAWMVANTLVMLALVLGAARLSAALSGEGARTAGALAFLLLFEGTHLELCREAAYPRYANWLPLMGALVLAVRFVERGRARDLAAAALLGLVVTAMHLVELALLALILSGWVLALGLLQGAGRAAGRALGVLAATLCVSAPFLVAVVFANQPTVALTGAGHEPVLDRFREMLMLGERLYVLDPAGEFHQILTLAGWAALLGAPLLVRRARAEPGTALVLGALVVPPAIVFNPLVLPLFLRYWPAPEVLHRLGLAMLVPWAVVAVAREATARLCAPDAGRKMRAAGLVVLVGLAVGSLSALAHRARILIQPTWNYEISTAARLAPAARVLRAAGGAGKTVLTDPFTGRILSGLAGIEPANRGVMGHAAADLRSSSPAFQFLVNPCQPSREALAWLRDARVAFVIHNPVRAAGYDAALLQEPYVGPGVARLLDANPAVFPRLWSGAGIEVYRVVPGGAASLAGKDLPVASRLAPLRAAVPPGATFLPCSDTLEVAILSAPTAPLRRGETPELALAWRFRRAGTTLLKIRAHLCPVPGTTALPGFIVRKLAEALTGEVTRFGSEQDLVAEEFQPLPVAAGETIAQRLAIPIWSRAAPASYELRLEVVPKGHQRRRRLGLADPPPPGTPVIDVRVTR